MTKDNVNNTSTIIGLASQAIAGDAAQVGEIIDTLGFESGKFSLSTGAVTTGNIAFTQIAESADSGMSGETVIPDERLINKDVTAIATANTTVEVGFIANLRYVRLTATSAGTAALLTSAVCELGHPNNAPV